MLGGVRDIVRLPGGRGAGEPHVRLFAVGAEADKFGADTLHLGQKFFGGVLPGARVIDKEQRGIPAVKVHRCGGISIAEGRTNQIPAARAWPA